MSNYPSKKIHLRLRLQWSLTKRVITHQRKKITYQKIKAYILEKYGFKVSSLYIAQIKDKCGLGKERTGNNWKKNDKSKEPQCTPEKEEAIRDAFKNFNMI